VSVCGLEERGKGKVRVVDLAGFAVYFADCDCFGHRCELRSDVRG